MPVETHITIEHCLEELRRIRLVMEKSYPDQVLAGKLPPGTRDHRFAVNEKLIELLLKAKANKQTGGPTFYQLLQTLNTNQNETDQSNRTP